MTHIFFFGIGGIGMSALARYFHAAGKKVGGYDKTRSTLTNQLELEGMDILFSEDPLLIPEEFKHASKENVLVVWTPAVPASHEGLEFFRTNRFRIMKRAQLLGMITENAKTIAIAGTHGKTTTTVLTAHLLRTAGIDCTAFLGGISGNYNTNLLLGNSIGKTAAPAKDHLVVVEADEYDRSFLWLYPVYAVVTAVDPDHLDIYGTKEEMHEAYKKFMAQVSGKIVTRQVLLNELGISKGSRHITYALDDAESDSYAENIHIADGYYFFNLIIEGKKMEQVSLGLPGRHNVENAVAAATLAAWAGASETSIRTGLQSFKGVERRFDVRVRSAEVIYIDDYGHHPAELRACISSVRELFPGKKITGIFQPHLYSRTRDFADDFARSLELLDDVILLEIYPAREGPIPGVNAQLLLDKIRKANKTIYRKNELVERLMEHDFDVLLTMGAGDIDQLVEPVEKAIRKKYKLVE
ncbi:MAG TPA: UDP-N-acetylmuramate--L-alanine ligase [Bacteroidia bacterium]|nr:UDP-N-acetylmuramate--L-alanine ligase [Bacteroidia bacterium]